MRKIREVMRLRFELHLGYQQIGRSCSIAVARSHEHGAQVFDAGRSRGLDLAVAR